MGREGKVAGLRFRGGRRGDCRKGKTTDEKEVGRKGGKEGGREEGMRGGEVGHRGRSVYGSNGNLPPSLPPSLPTSLPPSHPPDRSLTRLSSRYKQACFRTFSKKRDAPEKKAGEHFK
jgi:hypothetical protein